MGTGENQSRSHSNTVGHNNEELDGIFNLARMTRYARVSVAELMAGAFIAINLKRLLIFFWILEKAYSTEAKILSSISLVALSAIAVGQGTCSKQAFAIVKCLRSHNFPSCEKLRVRRALTGTFAGIIDLFQDSQTFSSRIIFLGPNSVLSMALYLGTHNVWVHR